MDKSHRLHICYSRIIIGMTTTMLLLLLTLIFMSKLIVKEKIGEESVDTIICVTIVLSTFIGTTITVLSNNNIIHSMSRAGTPTDNAAMEAINGWIKAEMFNDLHITSNENIEREIADYIVFFNEERPAYSLNYLTPKQYREYYAR